MSSNENETDEIRFRLVDELYYSPTVKGEVDVSKTSLFCSINKVIWQMAASPSFHFSRRPLPVGNLDSI